MVSFLLSLNHHLQQNSKFVYKEKNYTRYLLFFDLEIVYLKLTIR